MAKNATKQGKTTTIDPVGITVGLLAHADCEAASALGSLGQALLVPVTEPKFTPCTFLVGETEYCAYLTSCQCKAIQEVVQKKGDVLKVLKDLLAGMNLAVDQCIDTLVATLGDSAVGVKLPHPIPLGRCVYNGDCVSSVSQAQCTAYGSDKWDSTKPLCDQTGPGKP